MRLLSARAGRKAGVLAALAGALALGLAGCASVDTLPSPVAASPPGSAQPQPGLAVAGNPERKRLVDAFGGQYHDPQSENYLNGVLAKLASASDGPTQTYRITVLNSPVVNAFALPSGDIFVTRGLLALADDTSEIAAVMAHEIAHVVARHASQRAEFEKTAALFTRVNTQVLARAEAPDEAEARSRLSIARFSQAQELEADQIGIRNIARAGYDPYAAARFLTALQEWTALRASISGAGSANRPDMMATHPSTPERIGKARATAQAISQPGSGAVGRDSYLLAIDGLLFGDDPAQGVVRGVTFIHPKLGFAFDAPEGFTLENQNSALIGVGADGTRALRVDSIPIDDRTPVASAIASGWIDGLTTTAVEPLRLNGLDAATAVADGQQWSFRLAAVRLNGRLYRLIFAAHALSPAVDSEFRASIESFRLINARDSTAAQTDTIKLIGAGPSDTAEALGARMTFLPHPVDQFLILNGLERGAPLTQGQRYKVVAQ